MIRTKVVLLILLFAAPSWGADFLVMSQDKGDFSKGDIVEVFPDGRLQPQPASVPFVLIRVPGMAVDKAYQEAWRMVLGYEVLASNALGKRIRIYATNNRLSDGFGGLTKAKVENFLTRHNASVVSFAANGVVFDIANADIQTMKDDIKVNLNKLVLRRLYNVPIAAVDAALANGGIKTYTQAQVITYLKRKSD